MKTLVFSNGPIPVHQQATCDIKVKSRSHLTNNQLSFAYRVPRMLSSRASLISITWESAKFQTFTAFSLTQPLASSVVNNSHVHSSLRFILSLPLVQLALPHFRWDPKLSLTAHTVCANLAKRRKMTQLLRHPQQKLLVKDKQSLLKRWWNESGLGEVSTKCLLQVSKNNHTGFRAQISQISLEMFSWFYRDMISFCSKGSLELICQFRCIFPEKSLRAVTISPCLKLSLMACS